MPLLKTDEIQDEFTAYLNLLGQVLTDEDQRASFAMYALGLLSALPRKSVEPIAALCCQHLEQVSACHQRLLHFLGNAQWSNEEVRFVAAGYALAEMTEHGPIEVSLIDDTGMLKQGKHSVGVQRQYTGSAGKITNCQLAVSLAVATKTAQLPIDAQLYLPECWTDNLERRRAAKIPDEVAFRTKPELALEMLARAHHAGIPLGVVEADAAYGTSSKFRAGIRQLPKHYMVGVNSTLLVQVMDKKKGLLAPQSLKQLVRTLKPRNFRLYRWREGSQGTMAARFALLQVRVPDDEMDATVWLVIEQTGEKAQPYKYYLCSLPPQTPRLWLVYLCKARWRTEQMYMECKEELGLDHYEGRGYPGWNHHISAVLACYALVVACRERAFPPCAQGAGQDGAYARAQAEASARLHGDDARALFQSAAGLAAALPPLPPRGRPRSTVALVSPSPSVTGVTQ